MCISAAMAAALAAGGTAVAASALSKKPSAPQMPDPAVERAKADTDSAQLTNSRLAQRNRSRAASSLMAKPLDSTTSDVAAMGGGKTLLGQ
jgi:hypothetical protein